MYYARFFTLGVLTGEPIKAIGDRAIIILDGRESESDRHAIAKREAIERRYIGYQLRKGERFRDCAESDFIDLRRMYPIAHADGTPDRRYTIGVEFTGHEKPQYVVRFCDEYLDTFSDNFDALECALDHKRGITP